MSAGSPIVKEEKDEAAVITSLCSLIESKAAAALNQDPAATFNLGLSGGSLAKFLCQGLPAIQTDWARWRLFFCDERLVDVESSDSTWGLYQSSLVPATPLTAAQFLTVNTSLAPKEAASDYERRLVELTGLKLDMLLLGAGPDGHTCSLFPGHSLLAEPATGRTVAHITDSPKPPPARVTLTLPVINSAKCCVFAAVGQSKAEMMKKLLGSELPEKPEDLPARMVRPTTGELYWILDVAAASKLKL